MEDNMTGVTACDDNEETQQKTNVDFKFNKPKTFNHLRKKETMQEETADVTQNSPM